MMDMKAVRSPLFGAKELYMNWGKRIKSLAVQGGVSFAVVSLTLYLADLLMKTVDIRWYFILLVGAFASLLLQPLFIWMQMRMEQGGIEATRLSDLELNERDIREAVSNWVFIHYRKTLEGEMEFSRDASGVLNCKITVREDS
jgi:hypothetical protein